MKAKTFRQESLLNPLIDAAERKSSNPPLARTLGGPHSRGQIFSGDALDFLTSLKSETADIVFLDPPFNLGKKYSVRSPSLDSRPEHIYHMWLQGVLRESSRILRTGGALYLYHLPRWAMLLGASLDYRTKLTFCHWIAISMKNGFVRGRRLYPAHYALLMYTKGAPTVFKRPKLRPAVCRHCSGYIKDYGGYKAIIEAKGINLSDVWDDLSPVRHANRKTRSANELPQALFDRVFEMSGLPGGLYVDPFAGSGTGAVSAKQMGMKFKVCDLLRENCCLVAKRLKGKE